MTSANAQRGFTLLETTIVAGVLALAAACGYETLAQRPAQARSTVVRFAALVDEARALAAVHGDAASGDGTGASIQVVREGDTYVATVYAYRPIAGAAQQPVPEPDLAPLRTTTALTMTQAGVERVPPFAVFFSASGHASARAPYSLGIDAPLVVEPACPATSGLIISFDDGRSIQHHALRCEMAQLNIVTPPSGVDATQHR